MANFLPPLPMATCLAFYPRDNNILAVGMNDFSVTIYHLRTYKVYIFLYLSERYASSPISKRLKVFFLYLTFV